MNKIQDLCDFYIDIEKIFSADYIRDVIKPRLNDDKERPLGLFLSHTDFYWLAGCALEAQGYYYKKVAEWSKEYGIDCKSPKSKFGFDYMAGWARVYVKTPAGLEKLHYLLTKQDLVDIKPLIGHYQTSILSTYLFGKVIGGRANSTIFLSNHEFYCLADRALLAQGLDTSYEVTHAMDVEEFFSIIEEFLSTPAGLAWFSQMYRGDVAALDSTCDIDFSDSSLGINLEMVVGPKVIEELVKTYIDGSIGDDVHDFSHNEKIDNLSSFCMKLKSANFSLKMRWKEFFTLCDRAKALKYEEISDKNSLIEHIKAYLSTPLSLESIYNILYD